MMHGVRLVVDVVTYIFNPTKENAVAKAANKIVKLVKPGRKFQTQVA